MSANIVVGPIPSGLRNDVEPFNVDNGSFPVLRNAYQWRGRVKRKRGTEFLNRLTFYILDGTTIGTLDGSGNLTVNLITTFVPVADDDTASIRPGTIILTDGTNDFTDDSAGNILINGMAGGGSINYNTGVLTLTGGVAAQPVTGTFGYYPGLPVMGIEDLILNPNDFTGTLGFDTRYAYNILNLVPYLVYQVNYYKNETTAAYTNYVAKTAWTPLSWNGQDYQQFWTTNYEGALWATNGVTVPFSPTNIGMQYKPIVAVTVTAGGPPATASLQINNHGLVVGDFVFINEVVTTTGINWQTGYVTTVTDANNIVVTLPNATIATNGTGGIAQYLTNRSDATKDCIRWYDGDPTNGIVTGLANTGNKGWINFMPPLSYEPYSIAGLPPAIYYLVGAKVILQFKDRLLFFGPVVQTSAVGSQVYLQDTVVYSQDGVPYYTASFTGDVRLATTVFNPILVPDNETANPNAFFADQTGFGGFIQAGLAQQITTVTSAQDVLLVGFTGSKTRLVYTQNDLLPFNFFLISTEDNSISTFSAINMDLGDLAYGSRGFTSTTQTDSNRFDLTIPDEAFQVKLTDNGSERFTAQRDYISEWIYFTYPSIDETYRFPTQSLQYNYRDNSWAIFKEAYTSYGPFRKRTGYTWQTVGLVYPTWSSWNVPWSAGASTLLQPDVLAGNQQGFLILRNKGTDEATSLQIQGFTGNLVTSIDHCLSDNDYIQITGVLGTVSQEVNGKVFRVYGTDDDTFRIDPPIVGSGTYLGGGLIKRFSVPFIQTRQFPTAWAFGRKTRLGVQKYLLTTTDVSEITLLIYLSQNADSAYNSGPIVPEISSLNNALIYSTVLYTCPESTNLGLTPANINLQTPTAVSQAQIWHRVNTSLLGDTVQLGFTLSDAQMRSYNETSEVFAITGATQATQAVLSTTAQFGPGTLVKIEGVVGMIELNFAENLYNYYTVVSSTPTTVTLNIDSTAFGAYVSGGTIVAIAPTNQIAEIELHGFIINVSPSSLLA